ncbi:MAG: hypothetical protein HYV09_07170 [Deltaproteobacteria bacterium]|nr:hypothetical protein [Deltaproteobacteria bacterium]
MTRPEESQPDESKPADAAEAASERALAPEYADRPPFARSYPRDAELDRLVAYFQRGNHRAVRDRAEALAQKTSDPKVAAAARDLRARIEPDPLARVLLGATLALLLVLTAWAVHRSTELRAAPAPTVPKTVQTIAK